jgi:hypothetical protein
MSVTLVSLIVVFVALALSSWHLFKSSPGFGHGATASAAIAFLFGLLAVGAVPVIGIVGILKWSNPSENASKMMAIILLTLSILFKLAGVVLGHVFDKIHSIVKERQNVPLDQNKPTLASRIWVPLALLRLIIWAVCPLLGFASVVTGLRHGPVFTVCLIIVFWISMIILKKLRS